MASIVNYARRIRNDPTIIAMDENAYVGLVIGGIQSLGSISARLSQWLQATYPAAFNVVQVKINNKRTHWGGIPHTLAGGDSHRPTITPDAAYFAQNNHRFLLREFSAMVVAGHFIIQTDVNDFWDPNRTVGLLPMDLATTKTHHTLLSARADALQIDVNP